MTTLYPHRELEDLFEDANYAQAVISASTLIAAYLANTNPLWEREMATITPYIMLRELRRLDLMPGRRKPSGTTRPAQQNTNGFSGDNNFRWLSVRLEAEDMAYLTDCTDDLATIGVALLAVCDRGYGFTCKPTNKHDGFCATLLFRPDVSKPDTIALAAYGSNVRDTCIALLYKFEHCLGGAFPTDIDSLVNTKPRFG